MIGEAGHTLAKREIVTDDKALIRAKVESWIADPGIDVVITTGGTGFTGRDVTPDAVKPLFEKEIEGFSVIFHMLSFQSVATSTIQSRACGGTANGTYVFCLPGSPGACKDAWNGILKWQLDSRHRPCNLVDIMPRLKETPLSRARSEAGAAALDGDQLELALALANTAAASCPATTSTRPSTSAGKPSMTPNGTPNRPIADSSPIKPPKPATAAKIPASSVIQPTPLSALARNLADLEARTEGGRSSPRLPSREMICGSLPGPAPACRLLRLIVRRLLRRVLLATL